MRSSKRLTLKGVASGGHPGKKEGKVLFGSWGVKRNRNKKRKLMILKDKTKTKSQCAYKENLLNKHPQKKWGFTKKRA